MARKFPLVYVDGEIRESNANILAAMFMGFPTTTVGGLYTAVNTNVISFGSLVGAGVGDEELVAPLRVQIPTATTAVITFLRQKDNGDPPLISDTDHFLLTLTGGGFAIFDECSKLDKIYFRFSTAVGTQTFYWSAGYGEE